MLIFVPSKSLTMRLFLFILSAILYIECKAQNIDSLYNELDECIANSQLYIDKKEEKIRSLQKSLEESKSVDAKFEYAFKLYLEYRSYDDKKAKLTLLKGLNLAQKAGDINRENLIYSYLADQNNLGGYYNEALEWLSKVDEKCLDRETADDYYYACAQVYWELSTYSSYFQLKKKYSALSADYNDKFFHVTDDNTSFYYQRKLGVILSQNKVKEAIALCGKWEQETEKGSHEQAIMAYYMSECYKKLNDEKKQRYWLTLSALYDCRNAVMDQASLWNLAQQLSKEGYLSRAQVYVEYSWKCSSKFGSHTRAWQVSPVITSINEIFKEQMGRNNRTLTILLVIVSVMVLLLLSTLIFLYNRNKQLSITRNALSQSNIELAKLNEQLNESNEKMNQVNRQLHDSNRVKDEYIARFLSLCSEYIDKMDSYRLKINRRLKANQYKELLYMTASDELQERETKELFANFDAVFLKLYPTFVESFNSLLQPQFHQKLGENSELTTDMRMAALIRLGIDDSAHIAEFMRLSPNTVYNYRARLKSRASVDRNEFENKIKEIGL